MSNIDLPAPHAVATTGRTPAAARVGTVLAVPGRGDDPSALDGLAERLALDGYQVLVLNAGTVDAAAADLDTEVTRVAGAAPVVMLGVDTGAISVLCAVRGGVRAAGLVLVGMPGDAPVLADEARVRLRDPAKRSALYRDHRVRAGELLVDQVPAEQLDPLFDSSVTVPTLVLHGDADLLCPFPLATRRALRLRRSRIVSVTDTAHDVFRDTHRASAVAEVVVFAERLRCGPFAPPPLRPLLRSTW